MMLNQYSGTPSYTHVTRSDPPAVPTGSPPGPLLTQAADPLPAQLNLPPPHQLLAPSRGLPVNNNGVSTIRFLF